MMITLLLLLTVHFVADFVLQSNWMALNKSKRWKPLLAHTTIYSICFIYWGPFFVVFTFLTHTATDYITSRVTSQLWFLTTVKPSGSASYILKNEQGEDRPVYEVWFNTNRHWFFVAIGSDQLIHAWTLGLTALWLGFV